MKLPGLLLLFLAFPSAAANLLKNGSFEGATTYWMTQGVLDADHPALGTTSLRVDVKDVRSASFPIDPGRTVTISIDARAAIAGEVTVQLAPSNRELAQKVGWIWNKDRTHRLAIGTTWRRVSVDVAIPALEGDGSFLNSSERWWDKQSWILLIGGPNPFWIDGVTVAYDGEGREAYVPYSPVEVTAAVPDLPGYTAGANLLDAGSRHEIVGTFFNPSDRPRSASARFELLDYRGEQTFDGPYEQPITIPAGGSISVRQSLTLKGRGLMLARVSAVDGGAVLGKCDHPLTALAFEMQATKPQPEERFGASFRGGPLIDAGQRIGLAWSRWYPHLNWAAIQPDGPNSWHWPDAAMDDLERHGMSVVGVLYGLPKWAAGPKPPLPQDMTAWTADDPRWDDLVVETRWDRYVKAVVDHYRHRSVVWEIFNEPDIQQGWDRADHFNMVRRTYALIKTTNPQAKVLINATWPGISGYYQDFLDRGGADRFDVFTFHNYTRGAPATGRQVADMKAVFAAKGNRDAEVWFDEGWTYTPTSFDYPSLPIIEVSPPACADMMVRAAADLLAGGLDKLITFHIGYPEHGKSFWDWVGSGTEWWDDHGQPTVAVAAFNTLASQLGLSERVTTIRPPGAVVHVFEDRRHQRGVAVAWSTGQDTVLPLPRTGWTRLDPMGNLSHLAVRDLLLPADQRPCFLFHGEDSGAQLAAWLRPLDTGSDPGLARLPETWGGVSAGSADGNPYLVDGLPRWRVDRVWPDDPLQVANYHPLLWSDNQQWLDPEHSHGGQPVATTGDAAVSLGARTAWPGQPGAKLPALVFVPPAAGVYRVSGKAEVRIWYGEPPVTLRALRLDRTTGEAAELASWTAAAKDASLAIELPAVDLAMGQELAFVPGLSHGLQAANIKLSELAIRHQP